MKRLLKSWVFWVFVALPPVTVLLASASRVREESVCPSCWARRVTTQWRFCREDREFFPLLPAAEEVGAPRRPPPVPPHAHQWLIEWITWAPLVGRELHGAGQEVHLEGLEAGLERCPP